VELVVLNVKQQRDAAFLYSPEYHALGVLPWGNRLTTRQIVTEVGAVFPVSRATVIWFVADLPKIAAHYRNYESLLWRDCGSLLASLSFAASALGYASCAIGVHDTRTLRKVLKASNGWVGVGGIAVANHD
jgi:hypothetical protein